MKKKRMIQRAILFFYFDTRRGFEVFGFILTSIILKMTNKRPTSRFTVIGSFKNNELAVIEIIGIKKV